MYEVRVLHEGRWIAMDTLVSKTAAQLAVARFTRQGLIAEAVRSA
jgi:hypothetical protein